MTQQNWEVIDTNVDNNKHFKLNGDFVASLYLFSDNKIVIFNIGYKRKLSEQIFTSFQDVADFFLSGAIDIEPVKIEQNFDDLFHAMEGIK